MNEGLDLGRQGFQLRRARFAAAQQAVQSVQQRVVLFLPTRRLRNLSPRQDRAMPAGACECRPTSRQPQFGDSRLQKNSLPGSCSRSLPLSAASLPQAQLPTPPTPFPPRHSCLDGGFHRPKTQHHASWRGELRCRVALALLGQVCQPNAGSRLGPRGLGPGSCQRDDAVVGGQPADQRGFGRRHGTGGRWLGLIHIVGGGAGQGGGMLPGPVPLFHRRGIWHAVQLHGLAQQGLDAVGIVLAVRQQHKGNPLLPGPHPYACTRVGVGSGGGMREGREERCCHRQHGPTPGP